MKLVLLFELAGLLLFGSLFAPSLIYVAQGNPLPEIEKTEEINTTIEVATIDFEGIPVTLNYSSLSGFSYSDPNSRWERQSIPVCNANQNKCLYADFYHQFDLKQNGEILSPDQIIEFSTEDMKSDIYLYVLDTSSEILKKYTSYPQDIMRYCHEPNLCRSMKTVMPEDIYELAENWKKMSDMDKQRYIRNMDALLSIENPWHVFHPETGGNSHTEGNIYVRWYKDHQESYYISLSNSEGGYDYYELTEAQFVEFKILIQQ